MKKILALRYFACLFGALFSLLLLGLEIKAQTYNDGPVQLQLRIRRIQVTCSSTDSSLTIGSQTGFSPDEFTFKVWARDNADIDGSGWRGGQCLQQNFNPPGISADFNYHVFNFTYVSIVPRSFDLRLEAWENDCGSDGYSGNFCSGSRCTYNDSCCCVLDSTGCIQSDGDDLHCDANPFITNLDYRLGPPGLWYNHGFLSGGGCSNNCYLLEVETYWEYSNNPTVSGKVFYDLNGNCTADTAEIGIRDLLIKAVPGPVYTSSDHAGNYSIAFADTGTYTVSVVEQNIIQPACTTLYNVQVNSASGAMVNRDFAIQPDPCPQLSVDINTHTLRICRDVTYAIQYCNRGMLSAPNASIKVEMDSLLIISGSSIPWRTPQSGTTYLFDVGNIDAQDCGTFTIHGTVSCAAVLGQTHCVTAHIYPDSICIPPSLTWDSSFIQVSARCENTDTVSFRISNIGDGDMEDSLQYFLVEDMVMLRSKKFKLPQGGFINDFVLANGSTFRLEAQQSAGHPGKSMPSVTVEGCGVNSNGGTSLGFVITMPQDDANPFISIDCQEIIGSFDPNDKTGYPKGVGMEKFITSYFELEYKIRFQNTGTDTAFRVVIRDTLSPFLNIASVELGAASHPYEFRIYGTGILEWTFDNILLPDSSINEPASHGFVNFRVVQTDSNANGTVIENFADIYFDYNAPVKTNVEFHTVGDVYNNILWTVVAKLDEHNSILIYPNPFNEQLFVELNSELLEQVSFEIHDVQGRLIRKYSYSNTNHFVISNIHLERGMYFYRVVANENQIGYGKIVGY